MSSEIVLVKLKNARKTKKRVRTAGRKINPGDTCVIGNEQGRLELVEALKGGYSEKNDMEWKILRTAREGDLQSYKENEEDAKRATHTAQKIVKNQGLSMEIIGGEYSLERRQLKLYFKAPHRVDFRGLLKELAREFSTRIELEQVGPREAASIMGGIGRCGRELCCKRFLCNPGPIPMEVAQDQEISISPERITGVCGRLLCCLEFERKDYVDQLKKMPSLGTEVQWNDKAGEVIDHNVQKGTIKVKIEEGEVEVVDHEEVVEKE